MNEKFFHECCVLLLIKEHVLIVSMANWSLYVFNVLCSLSSNHKTIVLPPSHKNCPLYLTRILRRKLYMLVPFLNYTKFVPILRNETIILGQIVRETGLFCCDGGSICYPSNSIDGPLVKL